MRRHPTRFNCFSPPAMIAIFILELVMAIYVLVRYKLNPVTRLVASILLMLALFQLAEYHVCGQENGFSHGWTRIGFVAITLLPALALHLIQVIAKQKINLLVWAAYGSSLAFALIFGLSSSAFVSHICTGNYAIFNLAPKFGGMYFTYYYTWMFIGIGLSLYYAIGASLKARKALIMQVAGYLSFLLPTGVVNALKPETIAGIPSVMCGFAVIYAAILVFGIIPNTNTHLRSKKLTNKPIKGA